MARKKVSYTDLRKLAEEWQVDTNPLFLASARQYENQCKMLDSLKAQIEAEGLTTVKEYVKGRENVCANPLLAEWAKLNDVSQRTLNSMADIITKFGKAKPAQSKLGEFLRG